MLTYAIFAGLLFGLYFSLVGLGLNLVFGVMRIVNLAHGDFLMLGGFLAFWLFNLYAINPIPAVVIAFALFLLAGLPLYYLLLPRVLPPRDPAELAVILVFGVSPGVAGGLAVLFIYLYLYRTRLGYLTRAVMVSREEAISTGIDVHRVSAIAFGIGIALAAVAGVFAPFMLGSITPAMGVDVTITSFA